MCLLVRQLPAVRLGFFSAELDAQVDMLYLYLPVINPKRLSYCMPKCCPRLHACEFCMGKQLHRGAPCCLFGPVACHQSRGLPNALICKPGG